MNTNISTTREQSARLLKCGVPAESADMFYTNYRNKPNDGIPYIGSIGIRKDLIPAWSLSALLELIPQRETAPHGNTPCDLRIYHYPNFWVVMYHDGKTSGDPEDYMWQCASEKRAKTLIEACVKMIEWLTQTDKLNEI